MLYTNDVISKKRRKYNRIKKIVRIGILVIVFPMLVYNVTVIIQSIIKPEKTPSFLGIKTYVVISGSMIPEFEIGDIAIVKETRSDQLKKDDIISFREGQNIITHRIMQVSEESGQKYFKTKGDNNNYEDEKLVSEALVEGVVIGKIPFMGKIALLLRGKITIIVILIIYYFIIMKERKNKLKSDRRKSKRILYEQKNEKK